MITAKMAGIAFAPTPYTTSTGIILSAATVTRSGGGDDMIGVLRLIYQMEFLARLVGPKEHGPYLVSFNGTERETAFEKRLYEVMEQFDAGT